MELMTGRLHLRPLTEGDADAMFAYSQNPAVGRNAGWKPHESREETLRLLREIFIGQEAVWGIVERRSGRLIGSLGLIADPKRQNGRVRMLGYSLAEESWGKGYATEAVRAALRHGFETLGLPLITAYCYSFNAPSRRVLTKCGFEYEGRLRQSEVLYDGTLCDEECFSLPAAVYEKTAER